MRRTDDSDPRPDSAMGGASDSGADGGHPASHLNVGREGLPVEPDQPLGDAEIERRHHRDASYRGPERRLAHR
jgi:hypothetical protein